MQTIKEYLYEKWKEKNNEIYWESVVLGGEFRKNGCKNCGEAKEGNGKWKMQGKMILVCPHMEKYVNYRIASKLDQQIALLEFIQKGCPFQDLVRLKAEALKPAMI